MTMNPLVEKILHSTVEKSLDMSILNELEFTPDDECEADHAKHAQGTTPCSIVATHWSIKNLHPWPVKKVCENIARHVEDHPNNLCKECFEMGNGAIPLWQCWHYEPIVK